MTDTNRTSKQQCEHTKVFVTDSTMRRNQVPCPWCKDVEIERLRAELAEVTRISHLYRNEAERLGSKLSSSAVETPPTRYDLDGEFMRPAAQGDWVRYDDIHAVEPSDDPIPHLTERVPGCQCRGCERLGEKATRPLPDHLKAPVKAGDPCPAIDDAHTEHEGKCVYCGAPMAQAEATALYTCGSDYCPHQPKCAQVNGKGE